MAKFIAYLIFLAALGLGLQKSGLLEARPCSRPIEYFIASFDQRFGLSRAEFLSALSAAEAVWETASAKDLFVYSAESGELSVNLIYDYRQEATEELSVIERVVKTGETSYDALDERYAALKSEYELLRRTYESAAEAFRSKSAAYEASVERWNGGKRASREEFAALEAERRELEAEFLAVKSLETRLNAMVKEVNALVSELNALARSLNLNVEEYNAVGASRGETFAGGTYTLDESGERIDIYEFEDKAKLVRVLAHELGHALGLEHVDDPKAIMYYLNESENSSLSGADLAELKLLCGVE